jgi:hypothetical protein
MLGNWLVGLMAAICAVIKAYIWVTDKLLIVAVVNAATESLVMAATCAVLITAICALVSADISLDVVTAISAVASALIWVSDLLEIPVIAVATLSIHIPSQSLERIHGFGVNALFFNAYTRQDKPISIAQLKRSQLYLSVPIEKNSVKKTGKTKPVFCR